MATQIQNPAYRPSAILMATMALMVAALPAVSADVRLRVALTRAFGGRPSLQVRCPAGTCIAAGDTSRITEIDEWVTVRCADGRVVATGSPEPGMSADRLVVAPGTGAGALAVRAGEGKPATAYRGELELAPRNGAVLAINAVDMEQYLRGVVPMEIGGDSPPEAMKAQAVAARTFALMSRGRYAAQGYDLTDTVMSQVYGGSTAERPGSDRAVSETAGMALMRDGRMVAVDYYDDCGGVTAPGSDPTDYPPSVEDRDPAGRDFCASGRYHTWGLSVSAGELASRLQLKSVGCIQSLDAADRDNSGRVREVVVTGEAGAAHVAGTRFRALVGYERIRSTWFTVERNDEGLFVFSGRGNGHGHGLCQAGAIGMARGEPGRSYVEILTHYFPGCQVAPASDDRVRSIAASRSGSAGRRPSPRRPRRPGT